MKKTTGKVLSFVLSLALVLTSFPAMFASASTKHTVTGTLSDTDNDVIYLVNGGKEDAELGKADLQKYITGNKDDLTLESPDRQHTEDAQISAISHASGDRLVKWYDGSATDPAVDNGSIDDDTDYVTLKLRSSTVNGHETLNIQYKATYTDDDDNDVTIKATKKFDVYVYDNGETVIGKADALTGDDADDISTGKKSTELDDDFAEKTVSHETAVDVDGNKTDENNEKADHMNLTVWEATAGADAPLITWVPVKTAKNDDFKQDENKADDGNHVFYTLKSSNSNIELKDGNEVIANGSKAAEIATPGVAITASGYSVNPLLSDTSKTITYFYATGSAAPTTVPTTDPAKKITGLTATADLSANGFVAVQGFTGTGTTDDAYVPVTDVVATKVAYTNAEGGKTADVANVAAIGAAGVSVSGTDLTKATITVTKPVDVVYYVSTKATPAVAADWAALVKNTFKNYTVDEKTAADAGTLKVYVMAVAKDGAAAPTAYAATNGCQVTADVNTSNPKPYVTATVKKSSSGSITFTAEATDYAKDHSDIKPANSTAELANTKDVKVKTAIAKKILVDEPDFVNIVKESGTTYVTNKTSLSSDDAKQKTPVVAVKVNGLEVKFDNGEGKVKVSDKASVSKITGKVTSLDISDNSNVGSIALDTLDNASTDPKISVSDAKVGDVDFDDANENVNKNELDVNSTDAVVGNVTDANIINVTSGKTGDLSADDVTINADDDENATIVGDIEAKTLTLDSEDSKLTVGTIKAKDDSDDEDYNPDFKFKGSNLTVAGIDFDYRDGKLEFDDFQGKVPAPKNAAEDGASIETTDGDDRVEVTNDCDIDSITLEDDSQITFDGKLNVSSIDGDGTLAIAAGKMYIDSDVSGAILKLTDATLAKGTTAFTSLTDTVDTDDFDCYGFTLAKTAGSKTDTFKIDSIVFKGLSVNKTSSEIAKDHSETFTAYAYPGGTTMPAGYTVKWALDDADDSIFQLTTNANGTATVKVVGYDADFASNDKATLTCTMVDADGDEVDEDTYCSGECDITAIATPVVTHTSDTNANFSLAQGASYQFKITSSDGSEPTFGVGSGSLAVSKVGKSGNAYFYKITAVGKVGDQVGVYLNKARLLVVTISAPSIKLDTGTKLTVAHGKTYQFKATSTTAVKPTVGNGAVFQVVKVNKAGNNTFFTVKAVGSKGQCTGIYVNGVRRTVATVA